MSLAAIVNAMVAAKCTPEQIAAAVTAHQFDIDKAAAERREKAATKKAMQRALEQAKRAALNVPGTIGDEAGRQGTAGDRIGKKEGPHTPKEKTTPLPSDPNGSSVSAPRGASNTRGQRLPDDFRPDEGDLEYGRSLGLRPADIESSLEDMQRWAWANTGPKVRKLDWHMTFKGFLKRDASRPGARAGPGGNGSRPRPRTVADMAQMHDEPEFFDDTRSDPRDSPAQAAGPRDTPRDGFAGALPLEDRDHRRWPHVVDC